jgi:hypothetical protein
MSDLTRAKTIEPRQSVERFKNTMFAHTGKVTSCTMSALSTFPRAKREGLGTKREGLGTKREGLGTKREGLGTKREGLGTKREGLGTKKYIRG